MLMEHSKPRWLTHTAEGEGCDVGSVRTWAVEFCRPGPGRDSAVYSLTLRK